MRTPLQPLLSFRHGEQLQGMLNHWFGCCCHDRRCLLPRLRATTTSTRIINGTIPIKALVNKQLWTTSRATTCKNANINNVIRIQYRKHYCRRKHTTSTYAKKASNTTERSKVKHRHQGWRGGGVKKSKAKSKRKPSKQRLECARQSWSMLVLPAMTTSRGISTGTVPIKATSRNYV